jgi:hypothetical protein
MAQFVFHLVHGTQFYLLAKPRIRWLLCGKPSVDWIEEESSTLCRRLRTLLEDSGHEVEFRCVPWSGRNRHAARLEAAGLIRESVAGGPENARHFVVAHSHGGNACFLALKEEGKEERRKPPRGSTTRIPRDHVLSFRPEEHGSLIALVIE